MWFLIEVSSVWIAREVLGTKKQVSFNQTELLKKSLELKNTYGTTQPKPALEMCSPGLQISSVRSDYILLLLTFAW